MERNDQSVERAAFTLVEFAALFGKKRLWAYRQMWAQRIKVIEEFGPPMVPISEVRRLQRGAHLFNGDDFPTKEAGASKTASQAAS